MDKDTKGAFEKVFDKLESQDVVLKTVVERLEEMGQRFGTIDHRFDQVEASLSDVRSEIKRLDASVEAIPDKIDGIYGHTINDILERLSVVE